MDDDAPPRKVGGSAGNRGMGRKKGVPNKVTALLKDDILAAAAAAHEGGRVGYLTEQAQANPTAFLTLLGKVLPTDINADLKGTLEVNVTIGGDAR